MKVEGSLAQSEDRSFQRRAQPGKGLERRVDNEKGGVMASKIVRRYYDVEQDMKKVVG